MLCNQIVFTAETNSQTDGDDKSQLIIKNKEEYIRSGDVDALIEVQSNVYTLVIFMYIFARHLLINISIVINDCTLFYA